jgi:hypothetical protein
MEVAIMNTFGVVNLLLVAVVGLSLWALVSGQLASTRDERRCLSLLAAFLVVGLEISLVGLSAGVVAIPDSFIEKVVRIAVAVLVIWGTVSMLGLSILWLTVVLILVPSRVRRAIAVLTVLAALVVFLSVLNSFFGWQWNFPDVFGVVAGALALGFALYDRYLARKSTPMAGSE